VPFRTKEKNKSNNNNGVRLGNLMVAAVMGWHGIAAWLADTGSGCLVIPTPSLFGFGGGGRIIIHVCMYCWVDHQIQ
jgi:hypothetical protein